MNQRLQCTGGHEWDVAVSSRAEAADAGARCPTCNEIGQAVTPDPKVATVHFESQQSVFDGIDATLPGRSSSDSVLAPPQSVAGYTIQRALGRVGMRVD